MSKISAEGPARNIVEGTGADVGPRAQAMHSLRSGAKDGLQGNAGQSKWTREPRERMAATYRSWPLILMLVDDRRRLALSDGNGWLMGVGPRDVLEEKRGGLRGACPPPPSFDPLYPGAKGAGNFVLLQSSCAKGAEENFASNSGREGRGGGGARGGPRFPATPCCNCNYPNQCPPSTPHAWFPQKGHLASSSLALAKYLVSVSPPALCYANKKEWPRGDLHAIPPTSTSGTIIL